MAEDFFSKHDNDLLVSLRKAANEYEEEHQEKATDKEEMKSDSTTENKSKVAKVVKRKKRSDDESLDGDGNNCGHFRVALTKGQVNMLKWLRMANVSVSKEIESYVQETINRLFKENVKSIRSLMDDMNDFDMK